MQYSFKKSACNTSVVYNKNLNEYNKSLPYWD